MSITLSKKDMAKHIGHEIVCVGYALQDENGERKSDWESVCIECETCGYVLYENRESLKE